MTIESILTLLNAQLGNPDQAAHFPFKETGITGLATLDHAGSSDLAFFFSLHYQADFLKTHAGAVVTSPSFFKEILSRKLPHLSRMAFILVDEPYLAFAHATQFFSKTQSVHDHTQSIQSQSIHPTAVIAKNVKLPKQIDIGAYVVIESAVSLGESVKIYPHTYIGPHCTIGDESVLFPHVTLYERTRVGRRVRVHAGAVIGADGFGYATELDQNKNPIRHQKIAHLGGVVIGDDVEIGANSTIDRGTIGDTIIESMVKIDNQVQVGHNCSIGAGSILCGAAGMAGSSSLGRFVLVGAQSGTSNQVHVGDYSKLTAFTGVAKSVGPHSILAGVPARALKDHHRILVLQQKLLSERKKKL